MYIKEATNIQIDWGQQINWYNNTICDCMMQLLNVQMCHAHSIWPQHSEWIILPYQITQIKYMQWVIINVYIPHTVWIKKINDSTLNSKLHTHKTLRKAEKVPLSVGVTKRYNNIICDLWLVTNLWDAVTGRAHVCVMHIRSDHKTVNELYCPTK